MSASAARATPGAVAPSDLEGFRAAQQLAYRCVERIAAELEPGVTERQATLWMKTWLVDNGVEDWFHLPFAWFGDRTAFRGFRTPLDFFPTDRRLEEGMPFILDCAPIVDGCTADVGYSSALGRNVTLEHLKDDLAEHRARILECVRRRDLSHREIYAEIDRLAARQGYENRHREYPFRVLAHQVWRMPEPKWRTTLGRFGLASLWALARSAAVAARQGWSPLWNDGRRSNHRPQAGLWAVEPHLAIGDVGAKFEELLVVTDDDAFWLDDALPHVRAWVARGVTERARIA